MGNRGQHQNHTRGMQRNFQTTMENNKFSTLERIFMEKHHPLFLYSISKKGILQSARMLEMLWKQRGKPLSYILELPCYNLILVKHTSTLGDCVFSTKITVGLKLLYLVDLEEMEWRNKDKYLLRILLVACKKSITKKWLKREAPSVDEWIDVVHSIFVMERITFNLRTQKEVFTENWQKWITYISTIRPDFR